MPSLSTRSCTDKVQNLLPGGFVDHEKKLALIYCNLGLPINEIAQMIAVLRPWKEILEEMRKIGVIPTELERSRARELQASGTTPEAIAEKIKSEQQNANPSKKIKVR